MILRRLLCLSLALVFAGCLTPYKKSDEADKKPLKDMAGDTSFQAFIGRLRMAVRNKDVIVLSSLMTADFGYSMDPAAQPGAQVFAYWDKNDLWPVLSHLLEQNFVPLDLYMVAPPAFGSDPDYAGPRCGVRMERGSWKFAYFLPN